MWKDEPLTCTPDDPGKIFYEYPEDYDTDVVLDIWLGRINTFSFKDGSATDSIKYDNVQLRDYANVGAMYSQHLVRGTTTSIGCMELKCTQDNKFTAYCLTDQAELKTNDVVYEVGNGACTQDSDCSGGATAELAKGNVAKKNGNLLPKGADMSRLRYNCGLEAAAAQFVQQCPTAASPESSRAGIGENFFRRNGLADYTTAVNKMAWAKTRKMGCAIAKCSSDYVVVCRYEPRGNQVGQVVYTRGDPCTACASGAWCTEAALCSLP
ncbi:SCP-like protein [Ancylostoma duodenale]|uniref:SCP-like protein n=1 Tax=Ancylostoma duodenale TaxID=51022 RepID=A0A0C2DYV2_9BILA|nr:SCP-like protein [Ancylostoma duodenale]